MTQTLKQKFTTITSVLIIALVAVTALSVSTHAQSIENSVKCGSNIKLSGGNCTAEQQAAEKTQCLKSNSADYCDAHKGKMNSSKLEGLIATVINVLSAIGGSVAVIMIIIGGFKYVTSGGDSNSVSSAKNTVLYGLVGLVIIAFAQIIVQFVLERTL